MKTTRPLGANLSPLLPSVALTTITSLLLLCPFSANAQGGVPLWTNRYDSGLNDYPNAMAVDGSGNVIVTGDSGTDYVTIKYSSAGGALWTNRYNGLADGTDDARAIAVDCKG